MFITLMWLGEMVFKGRVQTKHNQDENFDKFFPRRGFFFNKRTYFYRNPSKKYFVFIKKIREKSVLPPKFPNISNDYEN